MVNTDRRNTEKKILKNLIFDIDKVPAIRGINIMSHEVTNGFEKIQSGGPGRAAIPLEGVTTGYVFFLSLFQIRFKEKL